MKVLVTLAVVIWSGLAFAEVEVTISGKTYKYAGNPRVTEVLDPIVKQHDWYWPSASVFKLDSNQSETYRQEVIIQLSELGKQHSSSKSQYQTMILQIESWQLSHRINVAIDYELARIQKRRNPAFADGSYLINLTTRPNIVYVEGAIAINAKLGFSENTCLSDYLQKISPLDIASKDYVYLIQPDGNIRTVGIAYWNSKCVLIMPGTQIYVPLAESLIFSDVASLNQSIVELLSNRVLSK